jgi:streptogramin lyase
METLKTSQVPDRRSIGRRRVALFATAMAALIAVHGTFGSHGAAVVAQQTTELQGMGRVSGVVTASKPFKAAQVYLRSVDKRRRVQYMVYTNAGKFRAVALFPGNYELVVQARGLESNAQQLVVKAGDNPPVTVSMHDAKDPKQYPSSVDPATVTVNNGAQWTPSMPVTLASYEEIYPPGPGREVLETLCMNCHGENAFPLHPRSAQGWKLGLDYMMGKTLGERDKEKFGEGTLAGSASNFGFGLQDRKEVLEYLTKNLGLDKKPRAVRTDKEIPLDEAQLGKAEYIEYYLPTDGPPSGSALTASDSESASASVRGLHVAMQVHMDEQGNQWSIIRGVPSQLASLDPRTGEMKMFTLPDPKAGVHELLIDRQGMIWVPEFSRSPEEPRLLAFNPKTEKWEYLLESDPDHVIRATHKGELMSGTVDSKGNIYFNFMLTGAIGKWDRANKKMSVFRIPTPNAIPYGQAIDANDYVWVAEWNGGKLGRFDTLTNTWTEFTPLTYPANFRRGPQADAEGNIWTGIWAAGNRPGKIAKLDPKTGRWTEWDIPHRGAQPYEASIDRDGNIWFPDTGAPDHPMTIGRFNPKTATFTFYPRPQFVADSTRVTHAADGSVHYTPRYGAMPGTSGFGVLYPDMDQITTLAALALNGMPGYAFKVATAVNSAGK